MNRKHLTFLLTFSFGIISIYVFYSFDGYFQIMDTEKTKPQTEKIVKKDNKTNSSSDDSELFTHKDFDRNNPRFDAAGVEDDEEVKEFFLKFQKAVAENDKKTVASMIDYPHNVRFPNDRHGRGLRIIKNEKEFIKNFDKIFANKFREFIADVDVNYVNEQNSHLWANWQGVTVGRGVIWIRVLCKDSECNKNYLKIGNLHRNSVFLDDLE